RHSWGDDPAIAGRKAGIDLGARREFPRPAPKLGDQRMGGVPQLHPQVIALIDRIGDLRFQAVAGVAPRLAEIDPLRADGYEDGLAGSDRAGYDRYDLRAGRQPHGRLPSLHRLHHTLDEVGFADEFRDEARRGFVIDFARRADLLD